MEEAAAKGARTPGSTRLNSTSHCVTMRTKAPSSNTTAGSLMAMLATWQRMRPEPSNRGQQQLHFSVLHDCTGHLAAGAASAALEANHTPIHPARECGPSQLGDLRVVDLAVSVKVGLADHPISLLIRGLALQPASTALIT